MKIGNRWISLKALHTFEAVARHGHMGKAAKELNVTQSAVSHQVNALEASLGAALFERKGRVISITPPGLRLKKSVQNGLNGISATALSLQNSDDCGILTVMLPASFLNNWVAEKLEVFLENFPKLSLRIKIAEPDPQSISAAVDVAIVFDAFDFPGRVVSPLLAVTAFPVCAPKLMHGRKLFKPQMLKSEVLIHEDDGALWTGWFATNGIEQNAPRRHIYAGSLQNAMILARQGIGFALTDQFFSIEDIGSGALIQPFGDQPVRESQYYLVTRSEEQAGNAANAFAHWIRHALRSKEGQI